MSGFERGGTGRCQFKKAGEAGVPKRAGVSGCERKPDRAQPSSNGGPDVKQIKIDPFEANYWWRKTEPAGALLNNLMFLFIVVPIGLVLKRFYILSFLVFAFMVPYGLFVRYLAVRVVRQQLELHPEKIEEFQQEGVISD